MVSASKIGSGFLVNLLSNDVARFDLGFIFVHFIWILPLQLSLASYLLYRIIGWAGVVGVLSLFIQTVPVQTQISRFITKLRTRVAALTDERVGKMSEIIQGIHVIKMYAWEMPFQRVVAEVRRREMKQIRYVAYARSVFMGSMDVVEKSSLFVALAIAVLLNYKISPDVAFAATQIFNISMVGITIAFIEFSPS